MYKFTICRRKFFFCKKKMTVVFCWRHTVPKLTPDGKMMIEIFKFGFDRENIGPFVRASLAIVWSPGTFSGSGSNFVSGVKIFGVSKNSRKASRRCVFVLNSWVHLALVKASYLIVSSSSFLRVIIDDIRHISPHEYNTKKTRTCPIVLGRQHDS